MEKNIGLGSWFMRHFRQIAGAVAFICPALAVAIELLGESGVINRNTVLTNYQPTTPEAIILDAWVANKFTPWFTSLSREYKTAFEIPNIPQSQKLVVANSIMGKIEAVDTFFQRFEITGLSSGARASRLQTIGLIFDKMTNIMTAELGAVHLESQSDVASIAGFEGIITDRTKFINMKFMRPYFVIGAGSNNITIDDSGGLLFDPTDSTDSTDTTEIQAPKGTVFLANHTTNVATNLITTATNLINSGTATPEQIAAATAAAATAATTAAAAVAAAAAAGVATAEAAALAAQVAADAQAAADAALAVVNPSNIGKYIGIAAGVGIVLYLATSSKNNNNN